ncbi:MAG: hypothetical protein WCB96_13610 [Candidatus Aminicenantales bacterium]
MLKMSGDETIRRLRQPAAAVLAWLLILAGGVWAQDASIKGQFSGWLALNDEEPSTPRFGLRYLPTFSLGRAVEKTLSLDAELAVNAGLTAAAPGWRDLRAEAQVKLYRFWLRLSSSRFEARVGLQKINFGSASLFRPLMWFDRLDPRDPLQITDGVSGLLLRYYFLNNVNFWLWGLYGNDEPKGWESAATATRRPEFGGRVQWPLFKGEMAVTVHHRQADLGHNLSGSGMLLDPIVPEERLALDGKWDAGIGLWLEGSILKQFSREIPFPCQTALTLGADYTFGLGNGLTVLAEHFLREDSAGVLGRGQGWRFSGLSWRYPLGLLDTLSGIVYYDWKNRDLYSFLSWQRTYDRWSWYVIGFWNPARFQIFSTQAGSNFFSGKGFQVMIVFNH